MPAVNWGMLAKAQDDSETIEEAIARIVAEHDDDEDSHLSEGQSLQSHKASEIIDHLADSIVNDKLYLPTRAYTAVVGGDNKDDFDDIQEAIDYVHSVGGGSVFIRSGTYNLPNILKLYENIELIGESRETVIINCPDSFNTNGSAMFNPVRYSVGTVSINAGSKVLTGVDTNWLSAHLHHGDYVYIIETDEECYIDTIDSNTQITLQDNAASTASCSSYYVERSDDITKVVTGSGTTWLSDLIQPGNFIKLNADGVYYEIKTVDSDTQITLTQEYSDYGGVGSITIKIVPFIQSGLNSVVYSTGTISVSHCSATVTGSSTAWSDKLIAGQFIVIAGIPYEIQSVNSNTSITLVDSYNGKSLSGLNYFALSYTQNIALRDFNVIGNTSYAGIYFRSVANSSINNVEVSGSSKGISFVYCDRVTLARSSASNNAVSSGSVGLDLSQCTRCNILYNDISNNAFNGLQALSNIYFTNIVGNTVNSNGNAGINMLGYDYFAVGNSIIGNTTIANNSDGIYLFNGSYFSVTDNVCSYNGRAGIYNGGVSNSLFKGNTCFNNASYGIFTTTGSGVSSRCVYSVNVCNSNTTYGIKINTGCIKNVVLSNILYNNGTNLSDSGTDTVSDHNITS